MIALRNIIKNATKVIFDVTADIAVTGTYHNVVPGDYDPAVGNGANTTVQFPVNVRTGMFKQEEIDGDRIRFGDKKIIIQVTEMTAVPTADDYFIDSGGDRWDMLVIGTEPTANVLILRGRAHAK